MTMKCSSLNMLLGKAGAVQMSENADRIPAYQMWQHFPGDETFVSYLDIDMVKPELQVATQKLMT